MRIYNKILFRYTKALNKRHMPVFIRIGFSRKAHDEWLILNQNRKKQKLIIANIKYIEN